MNKVLLVNAIMTPDGTYLESRNGHDFVEHLDANGELYWIDGGSWCPRGSCNVVPARNMNVYSTDPHLLIREWFRWGTYGPDGDQPLKLVKLKDLTPDHIFNIIEYCNPQGAIRKVFFDELRFRLDNKIEQPKEGSY